MEEVAIPSTTEEVDESVDRQLPWKHVKNASVKFHGLPTRENSGDKPSTGSLVYTYHNRLGNAVTGDGKPRTSAY